jgi:hypothetical protein
MTDTMLLADTETTNDPPSVYDFSPEENIWKKPTKVDTNVEKMFRAKIQDNEFLLFFPVQ